MFNYNVFTAPVTEKPQAGVGVKPPKGSDTCRGLAPSYLNGIFFILVRAVRGLITKLLVILSFIS